MSDKNRLDELLQEQEKQEAQSESRAPFRPYDSVALFLFLALFAVVFLQFFTRYVLNDSLSWTEEAARYLLICLTFVGAIKCQILDSHIRLEFIDHLLGRKVYYLKVFALLSLTAFGAFGCWSVWELIQRTSFQRMISLPFPKYYLYIVVIAALAVFTLVAGSQLVALLRKRNSA